MLMIVCEREPVGNNLDSQFFIDLLTNYLSQFVHLNCSPDFHSNPSSCAHRFSPQSIPIRMSNRHVHICSSPNSWSNVVDVEVQVFIHTGLQAEWTDDSILIVFPCCLDEGFSEYFSFDEEDIYRVLLTVEEEFSSVKNFVSPKS